MKNHRRDNKAYRILMGPRECHTLKLAWENSRFTYTNLAEA